MFKTFAIGRLGKDAIVNQVNGREVVNFSIAADLGKDKDGNKLTQWIECSKWYDAGKANIAKYMKKGKEVAIEGRVKINTYEKQDRSLGVSMAMDCYEVKLLGGSDEPSSSTPYQEAQAQQPQNSTPSWMTNSETDDIPF